MTNNNNEAFDAMNIRNENINKILDKMNYLVNDIVLRTGLTGHNEKIGIISGSSDSAWKVMYLISELFQSLNSVGNKVDDDSTNKNNQSDEKTELKNIINELKELAEFFDIAVISAQQLNRVGASVVDAADDKKSLIVNKKSNGRADYFEKIDLSSCSYISGFDIDIDFLKIKRNNPAVVIRAGYGNHISQKDGKFEENYKNAKDNGLKVGAYWYSYAHTAEEAIQEVRAFLQVIAGKQFNMPIVFDIEQNYLLNNTSVIKMRTEIITAVRSYCNMHGYNVQFITLNEDGKIVSIDNEENQERINIMTNNTSPTGWNDKFSKPMIEAFEKIKKDFNCNDAPYIWKLMHEFCSQSIDEAALSMVVDEISNDIEKYRKIYSVTPEELRKYISNNITEGKFDDINNISVFDAMDVLAEYLDNRDTSDKNDN